MMRQDLVLFRYMRGLFWGGLVVAIVLYAPLLVAALALTNQNPGSGPEGSILSAGSSSIFAYVGIANLTIVATIVAVLWGAAAGAIDRSSGVLRDLVLTGRSRTSIVLRRIVAASVWVFGATALSGLLILVFSGALVHDGGGLAWSELLRYLASMVPVMGAALLLAAGFSMLLGSRGAAVGATFALTLIVDNILVNIPKVGDVWQHVSIMRATDQVTAMITPFASATTSHNSNAVAIMVLIAWPLLALALGFLRLGRRDL